MQIIFSACGDSCKGFNVFFFLKKWADPGLFLFIFVLFKHNYSEKIVGFSGIRTRIVGVEGEHADHLTTTTAQKGFNVKLINALLAK